MSSIQKFLKEKKALEIFYLSDLFAGQTTLRENQSLYYQQAIVIIMIDL